MAAEKETVTNRQNRTDRPQAGRRTDAVGQAFSLLAPGHSSKKLLAPARCKTTCTFLHTLSHSTAQQTKQVGHVLLLGQCPTLTLYLKVSTAHMRCHLSQDGQELADGHQEQTWPAWTRTGPHWSGSNSLQHLGGDQMTQLQDMQTKHTSQSQNGLTTLTNTMHA